MENSPRAGGEVETLPVPGLISETSSTNGKPAGRYAVPRDAAEVPDELYARWDKHHGAEQRTEIRRQYRRVRLRKVDACLSVDAKAAGALFGISERAWRRLDVTGHVPRPIKIGRMVRWRLAELAAWVRRGCPDREAWESMK